MPTKFKRYYVTLPTELEDFLIKEATLHMRPVATHITWICEQRRLEVQRTIQAQNGGSRAARDERYDYDAPPPPAASASDLHANAKKGRP